MLRRQTRVFRAAVTCPTRAMWPRARSTWFWLALLDGRRDIRWISRRLGVSSRTFRSIVRGALLEKATGILAGSDASITSVALELGYADSAHFTRAFNRWLGLSPRTWRESTARIRRSETAWLEARLCHQRGIIVGASPRGGSRIKLRLRGPEPFV
jgi:Helix-turn-helix domain